jgi:hypothetical protein
MSRPEGGFIPVLWPGFAMICVFTCCGCNRRVVRARDIEPFIERIDINFFIEYCEVQVIMLAIESKVNFTFVTDCVTIELWSSSK